MLRRPAQILLLIANLRLHHKEEKTRVKEDDMRVWLTVRRGGFSGSNIEMHNRYLVITDLHRFMLAAGLFILKPLLPTCGVIAVLFQLLLELNSSPFCIQCRFVLGCGLSFCLCLVASGTCVFICRYLGFCKPYMKLL